MPTVARAAAAVKERWGDAPRVTQRVDGGPFRLFPSMAACPVKETGGIQQTGKPDQFWLPLASSWLDGELKLPPKLLCHLLAMATGAASMRPAGRHPAISASFQRLGKTFRCAPSAVMPAAIPRRGEKPTAMACVSHAGSKRPVIPASPRSSPTTLRSALPRRHWVNTHHRRRESERAWTPDETRRAAMRTAPIPAWVAGVQASASIRSTFQGDRHA